VKMVRVLIANVKSSSYDSIDHIIFGTVNSLHDSQGFLNPFPSSK
jgi:hypothetical protein